MQEKRVVFIDRDEAIATEIIILEEEVRNDRYKL